MRVSGFLVRKFLHRSTAIKQHMSPDSLHVDFTTKQTQDEAKTSLYNTPRHHAVTANKTQHYYTTSQM